MSDKKDSKEIESFSKELVSFDVNDVSVEELERRLELAVAQIVPGGVGFDCDIVCGTLCGSVCDVNCGVKCVTVCGTDIGGNQP
jgi:hypothetical protein